MEVANEFDRLYLPARKCRVNASLRDVGFSPVRCQLCGGDMKFGFFVIVMQCKHSFHLECFQDHFKEVQDNPQAADVGPGGYPRTDPDAQTAQFECRKPLLCPCAGCSRNLTFSWTTPNWVDFLAFGQWWSREGHCEKHIQCDIQVQKKIHLWNWCVVVIELNWERSRSWHSRLDSAHGVCKGGML